MMLRCKELAAALRKLSVLESEKRQAQQRAEQAEQQLAVSASELAAAREQIKRQQSEHERELAHARFEEFAPSKLHRLPVWFSCVVLSFVGCFMLSYTDSCCISRRRRYGNAAGRGDRWTRERGARKRA